MRDGVFRSMVHVPSDVSPHAMSLADELRVASLPPPSPEVDYDLVHKDLKACVDYCFERAAYSKTEAWLFIPFNGWCGWEYVDADGLDPDANDWRATATVEVKRKAEVQIAALLRELKLRGLRARIYNSVCVEISWARPWWDRLLGRWL